MLDKKDVVTFKRYYYSNQDYQPLTYYPKKISMQHGNKFYEAIFNRDGINEFYCSNNKHEMSREEFEVLLKSYSDEVRNMFGNRLNEDHFLFKKYQRS